METKFDPMTGEPIQSSDNMGQQPMKAAKKAPKFAIGVVSVVAVGAVGAGAYFGIQAAKGENPLKKLTASEPEKVIYAMKDTVNEKTPLSTALDTADITKSGSYAISANLSILDMYELSLEYGQDKKQKQFTASFELPDYDDLKYTLAMTDSEVQLSIPFLSDYLFTYDYTTVDEDGFLYQLAENDGVDLEDINSVLSAMYKFSDYDPDNKDLKEDIESIKKWFTSLDNEEAEKESFTINEKEVECKGYTVTITPDDLCDFMEIIAESKTVSNVFDSLADLDPSFEEAKDSMLDEIESLREEADDAEGEIKISFYTYKNQLAAILMKVIDEEADETHTLNIYFEGGAYRTQNIKVKVDKETVAQLIGETEGDEETSTLKINGEKVFSYSYNSKDGDLKLSIPEVCTIKGKLTKTKNEFTFKLSGIEFDSSDMAAYEKIFDEIGFSVSIKKDVKLKELKGDTLLINSMSEQDFVDLEEELEESAEELQNLAYKLQDLMNYFN